MSRIRDQHNHKKVRRPKLARLPTRHEAQNHEEAQVHDASSDNHFRNAKAGNEYAIPSMCMCSLSFA